MCVCVWQISVFSLSVCQIVQKPQAVLNLSSKKFVTVEINTVLNETMKMKVTLPGSKLLDTCSHKLLQLKPVYNY